jgi:hypothetical protein
LITLGIIGVVAAMTIPTLMAKINERQTVVKVKKAYSTLSNAMRILENDNDIDLSSCGYSDSECWDKLAYVLKGSVSSGAWNYYGGKLCIGTVCPTHTIQGLDGITYIFDCGLCMISNYGILVDINGKNDGPNEAGKDIFGFFYDNYDNKLTVSLRPMDVALEDIRYTGTPTRRSLTCDKDNVGIQCTAWIINKGNMDYLTKTADELGE